VTDYRLHRIHVEAELVDGAWNAIVRTWRRFSNEKPHVEQVTCRKATPTEAEERGEVWAKRWVDRHADRKA
jgi:hypothetical protein